MVLCHFKHLKNVKVADVNKQTMKKISFFIIIAIASALSNCTKQNEECTTKCNQNGDTGPCFAAFRKYYYDKTEKKCKEFIWGGCNGVVPFQTLEECQSCGCK